MSIQLEAYQFILLLVTIISVVIGTVKILWAKTEQNLNQNFLYTNNKVDEIAKAAANSQEEVRKLEIKFLESKVEMQNQYVARADYIRNQTVIESKIDAIAQKIENIQIKQGVSNG